MQKECSSFREDCAGLLLLSALLTISLFLIVSDSALAEKADDGVDVTPRGWPHQTHPITGEPYTKDEITRLKYLRKVFPHNLLLAKTNDTATTLSVARQIARQEERARRMTAGTASEAEIHTYYDLQRRLVEDRIQLVNFVLSESEWNDDVRSRYQNVLATSLGQIAGIEAQRGRSIEIAASRPDPGEEPPAPFANIVPKALEVMRGEPAAFAATPDPDVESLRWTLPTGESPDTETVSFKTIGLVPGIYEVYLEARKGGNVVMTSLATAHLTVTPGPAPAVDLAVEAVDLVLLPDGPQLPTGQFEVVTAVHNAGTEPELQATVSLVVDGKLVALLDGLSLKPGERRSLRFEPMAVADVNGKLLSVSIAPEDPATEENDIDNGLIRTIEIDPAPLDVDLVDPTAPFTILPSGVPIPSATSVISNVVAGTLPLPIDLGPIPGFADLHLHQMADLGNDGKLLWGSHDGPSEELALPECLGNNHAYCYIPSPIAELLYGAEAGSHAGLFSPIPIPCGPVLGNFGPLRYTRGWHQNATAKAFKEWPIWRTITHQQAYRQWLEQAHNDGLNLLVMSALNANLACDLIPSVTGSGHSFLGEHPLDEEIPEGLTPEQLAIDESIRDEFPFCNDRKNVRRQLIAAWTFAEKYPWYEIALTPGHAAQIIQEGKLAVVLSIEANKFIDADSIEDARAQLDYWVDGLGVRSFQPVHQLNNQLGGPSYFNGLINILQGVVNAATLVTEDLGSFWQAPASELLGALSGMVRDASGENTQVLTTMGLQLLLDAMDLGILIDISHMDRVGSNQAYNVAVGQNYYPLYISHARYQDLLTTDPHDDHLARPWQTIQEIKELNGMVGLRTGRDRVRWYTSGALPNNCPGSSRDYAQSYLYGSLAYGIPQAFGTDLNGFIHQMRPRFYQAGHPKYDNDAWACGEGYQLGGGAASIRANFQASQGSRATEGTGTNFDLTGFGHIGQIGAVLSDLQQLSVDTVELENSAENFVQMWFSAYTGIGRAPNDTCLNRQGVLLGPATGGPPTPGCP
jgi:microsomal dipeptidase-like Zn-dependent dipeptidase